MGVLRIAGDGAWNESRSLFLRRNFQRRTQFRPSLAHSGKADSTGTSGAEGRQNILTSCGIPLLLSRTLTNVSDPWHESAAHVGKPTARDDFQSGQTAKARLGSPCAVTPEKDMAAGKPTYQELRIASGAEILHR